MVLQTFEALKRWQPENPEVNLSRDVARLQPKLFDLIIRVSHMGPHYIYSLSSEDAVVRGFTIPVTDPKYPDSVVSVSVGYREEDDRPRGSAYTTYEIRVAGDDNKKLNHMFEHFVVRPRRVEYGMRQFPAQDIPEKELSTLKRTDEELKYLKNLVRDVEKYLDAGYLSVTPSDIAQRKE